MAGCCFETEIGVALSRDAWTIAQEWFEVGFRKRSVASAPDSHHPVRTAIFAPRLAKLHALDKLPRIDLAVWRDWPQSTLMSTP
jgi:hypothetical protein